MIMFKNVSDRVHIISKTKSRVQPPMPGGQTDAPEPRGPKGSSEGQTSLELGLLTPGMRLQTQATAMQPVSSTGTMQPPASADTGST